MLFSSYFLAGGAGFIGSHFIDILLADASTKKVTVFDNFRFGQAWHFQAHVNDPRLTVINADIHDFSSLVQAMQSHEVVMHFAANADISKAFHEPAIDFEHGAHLTHLILEACRISQVKRLIFTSGSGVYGEVGDRVCFEHQGNLAPISPYGASKLAGEAFIMSYCHMFNISALIFRFANVVGPRQTHGVAYDFFHRLIANPGYLKILGDGKQTKSYVHVSDIVQAVLLANQKLEQKYEIYNVAADDVITVTEIARLIIDAMGLTAKVRIDFSGGDRGWPGDVPQIHLNTAKIRSLGWQPRFSSHAAILDAVSAMKEHHDQ